MNMLIKSSVATGRFFLRSFSPFRASARFYPQFIQIKAITNSRDEGLEKRATSARLIHSYVRRFVRRFCFIVCSLSSFFFIMDFLVHIRLRFIISVM